MQTYDAIVVGTGAVGGRALAELARRGLRVLGLDRFTPGHDRGSSHGQTRIIRHAYFEHPDYVPLLGGAWQRWRELEAASRTRLLFEVGVLQIGPPEGEVVPGVLRAAAAHGLKVEQLEAAEVERRFAGFRAGGPLVGVFEQQAGYLLVEEAVVAQAAEARRLGAELEIGPAVRSWRPEGSGVVLETDRGRYSAGRLIVAAGAWAGQLLADLALPLVVLRKQMHWFRTPPGSYRADMGTPAFLYELPEGVFYGCPAVDERGLKVAEHSGGAAVADPLAVDRRLCEAECGRVAEFCRSYLPDCTSELIGHGVCLYTMTPDRNFIVDRHPAYPQVAFCAGLSGHGFKFAPVLGEALVELALDGRTQWDIGFLSSRRVALSRKVDGER